MKTTCLSTRSGLERRSRLAKASSKRLGKATRSGGGAKRGVPNVGPPGGSRHTEKWWAVGPKNLGDVGGSAEDLDQRGEGGGEREFAAFGVLKEVWIGSSPSCRFSEWFAQLRRLPRNHPDGHRVKPRERGPSLGRGPPGDGVAHGLILGRQQTTTRQPANRGDRTAQPGG